MTAIEIFDQCDRPMSEAELRHIVGRLALMVDALQARQRAVVAGLAGAGAAATCEFPMPSPGSGVCADCAGINFHIPSCPEWRR